MKPEMDRCLSTAAVQRGFTLIELMVGITVGLILIVGLTITFANTSQSYGEMHKQSQMIENGRYALDALRDELRAYRATHADDVAAREIGEMAMLKRQAIAARDRER